MFRITQIMLEAKSELGFDFIAKHGQVWFIHAVRYTHHGTKSLARISLDLNPVSKGAIWLDWHSNVDFDFLVEVTDPLIG